jgi:hypothetical protein
LDRAIGHLLGRLGCRHDGEELPVLGRKAAECRCHEVSTHFGRGHPQNPRKDAGGFDLSARLPVADICPGLLDDPWTALSRVVDLPPKTVFEAAKIEDSEGIGLEDGRGAAGAEVAAPAGGLGVEGDKSIADSRLEPNEQFAASQSVIEVGWVRGPWLPVARLVRMENPQTGKTQSEAMTFGTSTNATYCPIQSEEDFTVAELGQVDSGKTTTRLRGPISKTLELTRRDHTKPSNVFEERPLSAVQ